MAWNAVSEIFDVKRSFEPRCKEAPKRSNQGCEEGKQKDVELVRRVGDCLDGVAHLQKQNRKSGKRGFMVKT